MKGYGPRFLLWLAVFVTSSADAQDESETRAEFWPEVSVYIHPSSRFRLFFLGRVSRAREGAKIFGEEPYEGYTGAHLDFIPNKNVILRNGYRFGTSLNGSDPFKEHRIIGEQTFRGLLPGNMRLSDRNRRIFGSSTGITPFVIATV
jgi:hypothetical protein